MTGGGALVTGALAGISAALAAPPAKTIENAVVARKPAVRLVIPTPQKSKSIEKCQNTMMTRRRL
jgi:hypothetical protein